MSEPYHTYPFIGRRPPVYRKIFYALTIRGLADLGRKCSPIAHTMPRAAVIGPFDFTVERVNAPSE